MTEHHKYQRQLAHVRGLDPDTLFEGCQKLCSWLTDGELEQEPHKRKQPCPKCGGEDRFRFAPDLDRPRFFCNICMPTGGWDGIALVQEFADVGELDHKEAVRLLAEATGYGAEDGHDVQTVEYVIDVSDTAEDEPDSSFPAQSAQKDVSEFQTFELTTDSHYVWAVQLHRPEIDFPTYQRAGAVGFNGGIAIPMFDNEGRESGYVRLFADGSKKNTAESKSGIVGIDARNALLSKYLAKKIFKCAGVSDYLVLSQLIAENGLEADYYGFTNACGETENPEKFEPILRPALEGQTVVVIQDNDTTGEAGAKKWAKHFAKYATDVRIVRPPQEWNGKPIKDLRDFVAASGNASDVFDWISEAFENVKPITPDIATTWNQFTPPRRDKPSRMVRSFDEISTEAQRWFLHNKIPADDISIMSGGGAVGKTYLVCLFAAHVTLGKAWPDGHSCEMGSVLFFPPEGNEGSFKRRLAANDVDLSKCRIQTGGTFVDKKTGEPYIDPIFLTDWVSIEKGIDDTEEETGHKCRLIVIDPVMSFTAGKNPNRDNEVREILDPIGRVLQRKKATMLLLMHHSKADQGTAQSLVSTSVGWVNRARAVWQIHKDPHDTDLRYFVPTQKTNDCINPTAWSFRIKSPSPDVWEGKVIIEGTGLDKTADDLVYAQRQANAPKRGRPANERLACEVRLLEVLKDEDRPASEMLELLKADGYGESTIRSAKKSLEIESVGKGKSTLWHLPPDSEVENSE